MAYEAIKIKNETGRCLLCQDAPCSSACPKGLAVADIVRSLRFDNETGAAGKLSGANPCEGCSAPCVDACIRGKIDSGIDIPAVFSNVKAKPLQGAKPDLSIDFCGVHCENPFFLSSSVVGSNYEMVAKAFDLGWAGVAFKTIGMFVPDEVSPRFGALEKESNPFVGFKNIEQISDHSLEENLGYLKQLKKDYPTKVIIASIMGQNEAEWTKLAEMMEEAGADIIECNFSCPQMVGEGLGSDVGTNPELVARYTAATKRGTSLPVLAKMTPNITRMEIPAQAAVEAGADGIAAINTIKSVMNINLESFASSPDVAGKSSVGGYSGKAVKPIALRFIQDMRKDARLKNIPISGMGGIETWRDAAEFLAMGCETVQVTTAVMQYGYRIIEDMIEGLSDYLQQSGAKSVSGMIGKALPNIVSTEEVDRSTIQYPKFHRDTCVGCGRCYISCYDGGHQAIRMDENRQPIMDPKKCVGCQLCKLVCPSGSITAGTRVEKIK
jgi:dihydropyrimidine dehydrogenase (NAD+) subunit PreA